MVKAGLLRPRPALSLVVPTHDEAANVPALVGRVAQALGAFDYELIFVDDSDDATPRVIEREMAADPCVRLIHRDANEREGGSATAIVAGIVAARGDVIGVLDGSPHHPPEALPGMLAATQDADVVVASRYIPGSGINSSGGESVLRRTVSRGSALVAQAIFKRVRSCTDPMSGYFLFRREVLEGVELRPTESTVLLDVLVRGTWTRLTELPYSAGEDGTMAGGKAPAKRHAERGPGEAAYLRHLRELRAEEPRERERGPVRYRALRLPAGPDDPQPLDDYLPEKPEPAGPQRRRMLWIIALLALAIRVVLLPIGHWWDLTVDYNVFVDLIHGHSPYDTMVYLSHIARASGWDTTYEYYAYPPVPLYFYWPLAKIYGLLHPGATYFIPMSGSFAMPSLSLDFFFLLKLPMWIADFLIAALLMRMSGTIRGFRDYLLNPYVLLIAAAWTFDNVMLLGLVAGTYYLQQGKFTRSGVAMAFGTMVKFIPAIVVPTFVLYMIKKQRPLREIVTFLAAYGVACLVFLGPYLKGLLYVVSFHSGRVGGGMNWQMFWRLWTFFPRGTELDPMSLAIGAFGTPMLVIALLLAYWYAFKSDMRLNRMIIVTLLAFFVGSKLVNEQYALVVLPFAYLEMRQVGGAWRWLYRLLWIVPLAFAVMRVPIDRFLWLFYHMVFGTRADAIAVTGVTGFESPFIPWQNTILDQWLILILGCAFFVLSLVAILWPVRSPRRMAAHPLVAEAGTLAMPARAPVSGELAAPVPGEVAGGDTRPQPEVALPR